MNDALFRALFKKYEAIIEDSLYKINSFNYFDGEKSWIIYVDEDGKTEIKEWKDE